MSLLELNDKVMVIQDKQIVGYAYVVDICDSVKKLDRYFKGSHPLLRRYQFALYNDEAIYIVNFENEQGQGGYLQKNLKKIG